MNPFYALPQDILTLIYRFDPTYTRLQHARVMFELKMLVIKKTIIIFPNFIYAPPYIFLY